MKPYPISVQLHTVREQAAKDFAGVLKRIAHFGYVGVEFAGFHGLKPRDLRVVLDDLGLVAGSCHGAVPSKENVGEIVEAAQTLGYHWHITNLGALHFASVEACKKTAETMQQAALLLKAHGIKFGYHNHWWEFDKRLEGRLPHSLVMSLAPDLFAQIDCYWAAVGGVKPSDVLRALGPRVPLLHIKDGPLVREKAQVAVGDGVMDWRDTIGAADEKALEWLVVELDRCDTDMMAAVEKSVKYLAGKGLGRGRGGVGQA